METKKVMSVTAWVARDESFGGHLHLFPEKPSRYERLTVENGVQTRAYRTWQTESGGSYPLNDSDCPELASMRWEDEPVCVRLELYLFTLQIEK